MASSSRRSGYSRKAQFGVFTGYVIAGIGALVGAILLGLSLWYPTAFDGPKGLANDATRPAGEVAAFTRVEGQGFFEAVAGYLRAGSQNAKLKDEVELNRIRLAEAKAIEQENIRLKALLGFQEAEAKPVALSRLIGSSASSTRRLGYLGVGSNQGVTVGMPVRGPRGVVGRVLSTSATTSRILLLTDSQSVLPVRLAREDVVAFAEGRGDGLLQIRLVNLGVNPLKKGDVMVTSGSGGYYRPGMAVAIIIKTTNDGAIARMISDPAATNYVSVEPIWLPQMVKAAQQSPDQPLQADHAGHAEQQPAKPAQPKPEQPKPAQSGQQPARP